MVAVKQTPDTLARESRGGKYLTFALNSEEFGIEILKVREIIGSIEITAMPRAPSYVRGVTNLRGEVISVIDLRAKFGMKPVAPTTNTCIIVVEIQADGHKTSSGIVVDRVSEVLNVPADQIEPSPTYGPAVEMSFILGIGKIGRSVKILLDIDKVLSDEEVGTVLELAATHATS